MQTHLHLCTVFLTRLHAQHIIIRCRSGGSFGGGGSSYGGARSYSAPRTTVGPGYSPTYTSPTIIQPRVVPAFGFGFGYPVMYGGGGSSLFTLLILGIFAYVAFNAISGGFGCVSPAVIPPCFRLNPDQLLLLLLLPCCFCMAVMDVALDAVLHLCSGRPVRWSPSRRVMGATRTPAPRPEAPAGRHLLHPFRRRLVATGPCFAGRATKHTSMRAIRTTTRCP